MIRNVSVVMRWACPGDIERRPALCHTWPRPAHTHGPGSGSRYLTFPTRASSQWVRGLGGGPGLTSPHITLRSQIATRRVTSGGNPSILCSLSANWNFVMKISDPYFLFVTVSHWKSYKLSLYTIIQQILWTLFLQCVHYPHVKKVEVTFSELVIGHGGLSDPEDEEEVGARGPSGWSHREGAGRDHHRVQELRDWTEGGHHPAQGCLLYLTLCFG